MSGTNRQTHVFYIPTSDIFDCLFFGQAVLVASAFAFNPLRGNKKRVGALADLGRMPRKELAGLSGDLRDTAGAQRALLARLMASEMVAAAEVGAPTEANYERT